jgi:hypothetical protein
MPLIPHAHTAHFHGEGPSDGADAFWLDGTLELLRRCDAAVFIPGWPKSSGSRGEWEEAGRLGLPRFDLHANPDALHLLIEWLKCMAGRPA